MNFLIVAIIGYLLGSIPFGLILTKLAGMGDIRKVGSGNIGATNVLRTGNKKLAALVLLLDGAKGWLATQISATSMGVQAPNSLFELACLAGFFVVLGHMFPVWLKFKGGKGVATTIGVYLGLYWPLGALVIALWLTTFLISRISSLSAIVSIGLAPFLVVFMPLEYGTLVLTAIVGALVIFRHDANIRRLMKGEEPRFGKGKATN